MTDSNDPEPHSGEAEAVAAETATDGEVFDGFSERGLAAYADTVDQFSDDLLKLSATLARRANADNISAHHVARANEALASGLSSSRGQSMGIVGGVISGAGASSGVALLTSTTHLYALGWLTVILLVAGVSLVVAAVVRR